MGQQIDRVSDEFERAWKAGPTPRIEDYLDRVPAVGRLRLLQELLVVEFDLRQDEGRRWNVDVYRQRFPGSEAVIDAALALRERRAPWMTCRAPPDFDPPGMPTRSRNLFPSRSGDS